MVNVNKIKIAASFFAENIENLTITKLMKLFYYLDFVSYAERGSSVTDDVYYKLPYGPVPSFIKSEVDNLALKTLSVPRLSGMVKSQLVDNISVEKQKIGRYDALAIKNIKKDYSLDEMSSYEINLLQRIVKKFGKNTARELTERSHKEKPYLLTSDNSIIDYRLAKTLNLRGI